MSKPLLIDDLDNIPKVEVKTAIVLADGREGWLHPKGSKYSDAMVLELNIWEKKDLIR